jgi:hypothetical protein
MASVRVREAGAGWRAVLSVRTTSALRHWGRRPALAIAVNTALRRSVIMGESGPIHLVQDALGLDAKLVPLWRAMARYADAQLGVALETGAAEGRGGGPPGEHESELSAAEADRILAAHFSSR